MIIPAGPLMREHRLIEKMTVELYPEHIKIEDKDFFLPVMKYFSEEEQGAMVQEFYEFDRTIMHWKYGKIVEISSWGGVYDG